MNPYGFTDQLPESFGLMDFDARMYDPLLGRFAGADSLAPGYENPQNLNRYSYALNNPVRYNDPSGHCIPGGNCPGNNDETGENSYPRPIQTIKDLPKQILGKYDVSQTDPVNYPTYCGPAVNVMAFDTLNSGKQLQLQNIADVMQEQGHRISEDTPAIGGATFPDGQANAFNQISVSVGVSSRAEAGNIGTKADLILNIADDKPTGVYWTWNETEGDGAHWVLVVGYDPNTDDVLILNSIGPTDTQNPANNVESVNWKTFNQLWQNHRYPIPNPGSYVTYSP